MACGHTPRNIGNTRYETNEKTRKRRDTMKLKLFLIALPCFAGSKGFCHKTVLLRAKDKLDAAAAARHLHPTANIGEIKEVTQ